MAVVDAVSKLINELVGLEDLSYSTSGTVRVRQVPEPAESRDIGYELLCSVLDRIDYGLE